MGLSHSKYIQDDKKYQIFSILLKTGMSLSDYEALYKKLVHPAGFYLAAEVETQGIADINLRAGVTTDPLETPNYPIAIQGTASTYCYDLSLQSTDYGRDRYYGCTVSVTKR